MTQTAGKPWRPRSGAPRHTVGAAGADRGISGAQERSGRTAIVTEQAANQLSGVSQARALEEVLEITTSLATAMSTVIEGKPEVIQTALTALLAEGLVKIDGEKIDLG